MKCPKCDSTMNPRWLDRNYRHKCAQCGGIWLDKRDLSDFYVCHVMPNVDNYPRWMNGTGTFKPVVSSLIKSLRSNDRYDRYRAAWVIAAIGPDAEAAVPVLTELLLNDPWLQEMAAKALGSIGPAADTAIDALGAVMRQHHGAPNFAFLYATAALGQLGSAKAVPYLMEAAQDPGEQGPGEDAISALGDLGPLAREAVSMLAELLKDSRFCRESIVGVLGSIGPADGEACAVILRTLKKTRSKSLRASSVYALYRIMFTGGDPPHELMAVFKTLLKDRDRETRGWASHAVSHLHDLGYN